jgi:hypothetical protein
MLNLHNAKRAHNRIIVRVLLVAFCISIFAAPNTLADYSQMSPGSGFGNYNSYDFTLDSGFGENFPRENSEPQPDYTATPLAIPKSAAASYVPGQSQCAPIYRCFSTDLLSESSFLSPGLHHNHVEQVI